jgi:lipocalin
MRVTGLVLCGPVVAGSSWRVQSATWPVAFEALEVEPLAGDWFEIATSGSATHRRCTADTRFTWTVIDARAIDVRNTCTMPFGEHDSGRMRAPSGPDRGGAPPGNEARHGGSAGGFVRC